MQTRVHRAMNQKARKVAHSDDGDRYFREWTNACLTCEHWFQLANLSGVHAKSSILDRYSFAKLADLCNINLTL